MILVDTSVWIDHFRKSNAELVARLGEGVVAVHPFIVGELALGSLAQRGEVLGAIGGLRQSRTAGHDEVLHLIEARALHGLGIGYVDAHLLASTLLEPDMLLWTRDRRLAAAAQRLEIGYGDDKG